MQIRFLGEMTIAEVRQALFEALHEIEDEFALRHSRGAILYIQPIDGVGEPVVARNPVGSIVSKVVKKGPYRAYADEIMP